MPFVFRLSDLPKLDLQVDRGTDFEAWKTQWTSYVNLSGLTGESAETQVQALTLCFSRETLTIVENLGLTTEQRKNVDAIISALKGHIEGHRNESMERHNLRRRKQQPGESFDDFLVSLRELAKTCNFCSNECTEKNLRDQIIEGIRDGDTVEHLLRQRTLTLNTAITTCRAEEAAKRQRKDISEPIPGAVLAIKQPQPRQVYPSQQTMTSQLCLGCGARPHQGGRTQCPAYNQLCRYCHKPGHYARVCHSKQSRELTSSGARPRPVTASTRTIQTGEPHTESYPSQLSTIKQVTHTDPAPTITVHISTQHGSCHTDVLPDSGADISAAGKQTLQDLNEGAHSLMPSTIIPRAANGSKMYPIGKLTVTFKLGTREHKEELHIYPNVSGVIMSWKATKALGILPEHYPKPIPQVIEPHKTESLKETNLRTATVSSEQATDPNIIQTFPTAFDGQIRVMEGERFHIALTPNAKPFCVNTPRAIPFAYREKLKAEIDLLVSQNVIAPVTEPTEWCAPIVVTPKKGTDKIRMCVDLSHLNKYVLRERYQSPTPAQAVANIAASEAKVFTVLDALKGYHQCPLDDESQNLTTFITPFGRFKYLRAPYGISSISEHYNRRMAEAFTGLSGFRRVVDDIVIYDSNPADHVVHVKQFLQRCVERNIALNIDKCKFSQARVSFAGFQLSADGYQLDQSITEAISNYPTPASRTDLRAFVGLVNQLSTSTANVATVLAPFRPLLSTKNEFLWLNDHDKAFSKAKQSLTTPPVLSFFDITKPTRLSTDASRQGLGFILQQKTSDEWTLVQAGSRFLSDVETRYATIELELLAISWAVLKCNMFLEGLQHFDIVTDHNPLISILNSRRLDEIDNPRLQRLKSRLMAYSFTAKWVKGSKNDAPDALSRNPIADPKMEDTLAEYDCHSHPAMSTSEIRAITDTSPMNPHLQDLRDHAAQDPEYQQLQQVIFEGFPDHRSQLHDSCRRYWNVREHLSIDDNLIVHGCRLLIPTAMRQQILSDLHKSHQGSVRTKQRARLTVYWPGIDNDIDNLVLSCKKCQDLLPANTKEPIISKPRPARPFQQIAVDFCSYGGQDYLIIVDCYTDWPDIIHMGHDTTAPQLIKALRQSFCRTAIPEILWSDGGPQFTAKLFKDFSKQWGFTHQLSSPYHPQSNGKIEATVKSMKKLIATSWDTRTLNEDKLCHAILQYRNTPSRRDGLSPAQKLYGRPIQDTLPAHRRSFATEWQRSAQEADQQAAHTLQQSESYYNEHTQSLPDMQIGSTVALQNPCTKLWDIYGTIVDIGPHRRYHVKTHSGRVLVRNRRFLRHRLPTSLIPSSSSTHLPTTEQPLGTTQPPNTIRRSERTPKPITRLIEDPHWP